MDVLLGKVTQQAMNYAIRSGVGITASFAIRQSARLLQNTPRSNDRDELILLQQRLQSKIRIISPAIDMIELIAARGNTSLESAVSLTKELRYEIQSMGQRLATAAASAEAKSARLTTQSRARNELELKLIVVDIKKLLERIEDAVPLINLAITTSGASLSTTLPATVSPSRLLQASTFLTAGDTQFSISPDQAVQIGPTFTLSVYMLFAGHDRPQNEEEIRETTWKEVIHKARVKLRRVPMDVVVSTGSGGDALPHDEISSPPGSFPGAEGETDTKLSAAAARDEYAYQLILIEDFDDDRVHDYEEGAKPGPFDDVPQAGIREMIPVHEISKIFYADTSKVLNIGADSETNHPVLLLKRDVNAVPPRRMIECDDEGPEEQRDGEPKTEEERKYVAEDHADRKRDPWRLPPSLDPEWIAFEVYAEAEDSDSESDFEQASEMLDGSPVPDTPLSESISQLKIDSDSPSTPKSQKSGLTTKQPPPWVNAIRTSLSLLELLLRLTSLQQFQQQSHLSITDELLNFFLEESATTGAGGDEGRRQALRADARRRVGWDPYDESPIKRRGEDYQYYTNSPRVDGGTPNQVNGGWSSPDIRSSVGPSRVQTVSPPSSQDLPAKNRPAWLNGQEKRKASPLRTQRVSDEGIGTSPGTGQEIE